MQMTSAFIYRKYLSDVNWHKLFALPYLLVADYLLHN